MPLIEWDKGKKSAGNSTLPERGAESARFPKERTEMLRRLCGRKKAACLLGGGMYALFAAFGWQAEHNGGCHPVLALVIAAVLLLPASEMLAWLFEKSEAGKRS